MAYAHQSCSNDGRFELQVEAWEARNTHWVFAPRLRDTSNGKVVFKPEASTWSADSSTWAGTQVRIVLRKYPGDQRRPCLTAVVDCERKVGCIEGGEMVPLAELEALLDRTLAEPASSMPFAASTEFGQCKNLQMQIKYRFQFSEDHFLLSLLRYQQQVWWLRPLFEFKWLLVFLLFLPMVFFAYKRLPVLAVVFMAGIALLLSWPIHAWMIRRRFRKSPFHNEKIEFSLSASGAHAVGRNSEVRNSWAVYTRARRFKDGLMLFQGPHVFNWLPDTAAADAAAIAAAQELARTHIRDYRDF